MSVLRAVVAALAAALLVCSGASAIDFSKPRSTVVVKRTKGAAAVDGSRYAAWGGADGLLAVYDERRGGRKLFDLGRHCDHVLPISAGRETFLVNCSVTGVLGVETYQYLFEAATSSVRLLDGAVYSQVGRQWLQGNGEDRFGRFLVYTNWHTGETITEAAGGRARVPYDLDSPALDAVAPAAGDFVVGESHALERVGQTIRLVGWDGDLVLHRCLHECAPVSVKGGLALWTDGDGKLFGYRLSSGRRYAWRVPESAEVRGSTGRRVYYLFPLVLDPQYFALKSFRWR